jgi:hypothetical protein
MCTRESLTTEPLVDWVRLLRPAWWLEDADQPVPLHRKLWEWAFIAQTLAERGMLEPGRRGLGFGVGREPLAALFAGRGCDIVATDLPTRRARRAGWTDNEQHAAGRDELLTWDGLCSREQLQQRVTFRSVDMRKVPDDLRDFDFLWSSCALEHLGSISNGQDFVIDSLRCLRTGGVAVHTTELNLSSDRRTLALGQTVILRRRDVAWLGRHLGPFDADALVDRHPDEPVAEFPYGYPHIRVNLRGHTSTSFGIAVERTDDRPAPEWPSAWRRARSTVTGAAGAVVRRLEVAYTRMRRRSPRPPDG